MNKPKTEWKKHLFTLVDVSVLDNVFLNQHISQKSCVGSDAKVEVEKEMCQMATIRALVHEWLDTSIEIPTGKETLVQMCLPPTGKETQVQMCLQ